MVRRSTLTIPEDGPGAAGWKESLLSDDSLLLSMAQSISSSVPWHLNALRTIIARTLKFVPGTEATASERHACLLMDNCSANQTTCELDNIELKFLPPNTTARLQPLDRSTKSFKAFDEPPCGHKVDQLGAIHMMTGAWNSVKQSVANCFRKAGFVTAEHSEACEVDDEWGMDDTFRELSSLFPAAVLAGLSAGDFVNADSNVDVVAALAGTQAGSLSGEDRPDEDAATRSYSPGELAAAWVSFSGQSLPDDMVTRAFRKCSISNAPDGMEDDSAKQSSSDDSESSDE
ncbi:hypothetical protein HPB48_013867 [Haemaphysalis longicornis]|uniref:DDE-1 domain-containing protein n=1 Tax=Haemaphysalis longicornis TaxID=44386 RepID=A0A9J6FUK8_HAELO|nr:hypothetical protein HPB48_013867 [Haemaphysalis longicornis]